MRKMYSKKQIEEIAKSSGTKLYKHLIEDSNMGYYFILITTNHEPIDFSSIDSYSKFQFYLISQNVIRFTDDTGDIIQYESNTNCFYLLTCAGSSPSILLIDGWSLVNTTDTITAL